MGEIIIGTRSSKLAMIQTDRVINALKKQGVTQPIKIKDVMTEGDQNLQAPLASLGRGVFLEALEEQLLDGSIDMAVHSLKDVPVSMPEGLTIACIPEREDHRDAYIANGDIGLHDLPAGAVIGTSSLRRAAQLLAKRPDLRTKWIRGPIDSRIEQLHNGDFDAIILAVAGMKRLGIDEDLITEYLPEAHFVPAMGQGALAIECRSEDEAMRKILAMIHDEEAAQAVRTERLFLQAFDEGEQAPIGGYAFVSDGMIHLRGMVISLNGQTVLKYEASGERPEAVAQEVADVLINQGAMKIIAEAKQGM
ncbi:MAG TPA: hydroxymethylbilane synthase [Virgibacillus sp.]|nr:hydroxymethylbilane synthase [Virgibacillus sp.]HLR68545.1 hydroxymethylbilane synthase [Virgibacillus sp.]